MAQQNQKNNPLSAIEAKILNALTNYETHSKYKTEAQAELENLLKQVENKKAEIAELAETAELNLRLAESMKLQKAEIANFAELAKKLGLKNAQIGWELAFNQPPTEPEPEQQPESKDELVDRWVAETEEKTEQQPQTEPIAAKANDTLPGATASEQIANIPPVKKPEAPTEPTSEPSPTESADKIIENCFEIDGYSFKFDNKNFEFFTPDKQRFEGCWSNETPAPIGLRTGNRKLFVSTLHPQEWLSNWDEHLFAIEKALQEFTGNSEFKVKFPARATSEKFGVAFRKDGLILLPMDGPNVKTTRKCNGYTVSFVEGKSYEMNSLQHFGITLKIVGQGTGQQGLEVHCGFSAGEEKFFIACKDATGKKFADIKENIREQMPKWTEPLRNAASTWMRRNFDVMPKYPDSTINYITPAPVPTDKQPTNTAANDELVK